MKKTVFIAVICVLSVISYAQKKVYVNGWIENTDLHMKSWGYGDRYLNQFGKETVISTYDGYCSFTDESVSMSFKMSESSMETRYDLKVDSLSIRHWNNEDVILYWFKKTNRSNPYKARLFYTRAYWNVFLYTEHEIIYFGGGMM